MEGFRCPNRPNFGSKGNAIILRANHFKIGVRKSFIQHYIIKILPDILSKRHRRNIFEKLLQVYSSIFAGQLPVFDGIENIYSKDPLPMIKGKLELEVLLPDDERVKVKVLIQWISQLSLPDFSGSANELNNKMPYSSIQVLDVIMRHSASMRYTPIGRSFFQPPENSNQSLGGGRQVWYGHFQNVQLSCWKNMLNMDVAAAAFYKAQSVEKFMMEVLGITEMSHQTRPLCEGQRKKLCKEITGLKVEVTHSGYKRKYKVTGVTSRPARTQSFPLTLETGQTVECTVVKYFREKYNIILEFPYLPCLTVGKEERHTYFPLEVCSIVKGQKCNKRLTDFQASGMINATALSARDREREINNLVLQANFNENPHLRKFDISVNTEMTVVRGRVLSPPMILYAGPNKAEPRLGVWDGREKPFVKAVVIQTWVIASFVPQESLKGEMLESFALELYRKSRSSGMHIKEPPSYRYADNTQIELFFKKLKSEFPELQLVCVVLPPKNKIYCKYFVLGY
ncbi:hypothetical protein EB796_005807 [Bugula neritina]|uniref:PAZ domain-containing protein n=1 Tax=Bugula neritina TaxID=10212 RepID=A0A7J7KB64_BUGNE|nr:hypothetical protein EB796_005807 [Bugula neritina]